jgi:putative transposase
MNKYNTVLGQILDLVSRKLFERLVQKHKAEYKSKGFRSWTQFVVMVFGQISGQHGLRSMVTGLNSQRRSWYHLGLSDKEIKRSSLSYANNHRSSELFKSLFEALLGEAQKHKESHGFRFKNPLYSMDATVIDLCMKLFPWAEFRKGKAGIKLTVKLDHQGKIPCFVVESNAKEHDGKKAWSVPFTKGDVAVFDRGYFNLGYFWALNVKKVWFVTRLKKNVKYRRIRKHSVSKAKNIISDYEIRISGYSRTEVLRKITARDPETGKRITLLTNNLFWSPVTVSGVYKDRWQIELFFKAIKQNLKIKRFYGNSKNAVMTQVWIALIVYLLFYLLKRQAKVVDISFTNFMSVIKTMLFQRILLFDWLINPSPPLPKIPACTKQSEFEW